jgi:hypothetical protein
MTGESSSQKRASAAEYSDFIRECDRALHAVVSTYELMNPTRLPASKVDYWITSFGYARSPLTVVQDLLLQERHMLQQIKLRTTAAYDRGKLRRETLAFYHKLVATTDRPAQDAKHDIKLYLTSPELDLPVERAVFRKLVDSHRPVVEAIHRWEGEDRAHLESFARIIADRMREVGWLFQVFFCYAHKDDRKKSQLAVVRTFLEKRLESKNFSLWWDRDIPLGARWHRTIMEQLGQADAALVIVSEHFMQSDYISREELRAMLGRRRGEGLRICPVLLTKCDWRRLRWLRSTEFVPKGSNLESFAEKDDRRRRFYQDELGPQIDKMLESLTNPREIRDRTWNS